MKKTGASWGSRVEIDNGGGMSPTGLWVANDGVPRAVGYGKPSGNYNPSDILFWEATDDTGASWTLTTLQSGGSDQLYLPSVSGQYTAGLEHTRLAGSGYALFYNHYTDDDFYFGSDNPTWAVAGSDTQEVEDNLTFSQDIELPDSPTTVTAYWEPILEGGRSLTRNSSGTEWMAVRTAAGSGLYAFSRALGAAKGSWSFTNVETGNTYDSVSMCIDENGFPMFLAHKSGTSNIKVFGWNGSAYVQNANISTNHSTIGSMECWYDGTLYHMVYPHKKSGGKWRLLHRTSTNPLDTTNRWSGSTEVWLTDNSTNSDSLRDGRRIAGMLDSNDDYHLIVSSKDSSQYRLRYYVYDESAGTWDSGTEITSSATSHFDGLSLATDASDDVHLVYRAGGILVYQENSTGSFVSALPGLAAGRSSEAIAYPSIGMRRSGTQPSIIIQNEDDLVGEWHNDGTGWSWLGIFTNTESYTGVAPCTSYNRRRNYQRTAFGIAFSITGSLIYVGSSYIQWDDAAEPAEAGVEFSQDLSIFGYEYPEHDVSITQSSAAVRERSISIAAQEAQFSHLIGAARNFGRSNIADDADVGFHQQIGMIFVDASDIDQFYLPGIHQLNFEQTLVLELRKNLGSSDDLEFSQEINLTLDKTIETDVDFNQEIDLLKILTKSIASAFNVSQVIVKTGEWNRGVTHSVTFGAEGLAVRDWNAYDPDITISGWNTYEDDVLQVVFQWPAALPTESVTFMRPNFGDTRVDSRRSGAVRRNRSGRARTYAVPV